MSAIDPTLPTVHLTEYWHLLLRRKRLILYCLAICIALAVLYNSRLEPIYSATATLILDRESSKSPLTGQRVDYETYMSENLSFNTHFKLITSRSVMERVVHALKLDSDENPYQTQKPPVAENPLSAVAKQARQTYRLMRENLRRLLGQQPPAQTEADAMTVLVETLQSMVQIEPIEETRLMHINVSSPDPMLARDAADAVAKAYIDFNIGNRLQATQDTMQWLTGHLYEMKKNLEDAEGQFQDFKQNANLISVEDRQKIITRKISEFNDAYLQARNRRLELEAKLEQLNRILASGKDIIQLRSLIPSPIVNDLYSKSVALEAELASLNKVFKAMHPKVVQVTSQLQEVRSNLQQEIRKELDGLRAEQAILQSREKVLQQTIGDFEKEGLEANKKELRHSILKRNVELNQNLYDTLLTRLKEADITGNLDVSNIRITEKAVLPVDPIGPNRKRNLLLAALLGLMAGIGLAFLKEYLDRTLHTEEDVQRWLDLTVLAAVPVAHREARRSSTGKHSS